MLEEQVVAAVAPVATSKEVGSMAQPELMFT
jgi:hypothetical protein